MKPGFAIVPPANGEQFVELSRSAKGRIFEKHILSYGDLLYPGVGKVHIDDDWADKLIENFNAKVCPIVQVPLANEKNEHSEAPDRNIGEVIGLTKRNGKVYAQIDARKEEAAKEIGNTLLGASAMLHLNWKDTSTGERVGPTLIHVAITNNPYINKLDEFEELNELIAASADGSSEAVILTAITEKEIPMDLDELIKSLRDDHNIDVPALQKKAADADNALKLSNKIQEELGNTGLLKLSNGSEASADDLISAVSEAGSQIVALTAQVDGLVKDGAQKAAVARVDSLIKDGKILPKNKEAQIKLLLSNAELFEELLPEKALVKLSNAGEEEFGFEAVDDAHEKTVTDEIERLSGMAKTASGKK